MLFTIEHNKWLNLYILYFYPLNELISNCDACYRFKKKLARGQQRAKKSRNIENIQLGEHLATIWHQVFNMISFKRDVLERQSLSEVNMGRGSLICERVHKKVVEYFKNNVPQQQIAKVLQITSSKDSEKLEKSLCVRDKAEDFCGSSWSSGPQTKLHHSSAWFCH